MSSETRLEFVCPKFFSEGDEKAFFTWLQSFAGEATGVHRSLHVNVTVDEENLRELIALFFRYNIDMRQLAQFGTEENENWFKRPEKFWYKSIFGGN